MDDLIRRSELMQKILNEYGDVVKSAEVNKVVDEIYGMVINAPAVDAVPIGVKYDTTGRNYEWLYCHRNVEIGGELRSFAWLERPPERKEQTE